MQHQIEYLLIGAVVLVVAYTYVFYRIFKSNNDNNKKD